MSKALIIVISITIQIIINIIFVIYRHKTNKQEQEDSVGKIIINQSDPDKEYFECQLYSKDFFKEVHQKESVTFDVVIR